MGGDDVIEHHVPPGGGSGDHKGTGFDLVGYDGVGAAVELPPPLDADHIGARSLDTGPHHVEEVGYIHHMGLLGGVGDDGLALGAGGGQHDVDGSAHTDHVQIDLRAGELGSPGFHDAVFDAHVRAQGPEAFDVLVDGALANGAAAGEGDGCLLIAAQQSAQQVIGRPQGAHHIKGDLAILDTPGIHPHFPIGGKIHLGAHAQKDGFQLAYVLDGGEVFQQAAFPGQDGSGNDGQGSVFGAADGNHALQPGASCDLIMSHMAFVFLPGCYRMPELADFVKKYMPNRRKAATAYLFYHGGGALYRANPGLYMKKCPKKGHEIDQSK